MKWSAAALAWALLVTACTAKPSHTSVEGCSPYVTGQCVTPFPNAWFEAQKAPTSTGYAVTFPSGVLPVQSNNDPVGTDIMGPVDGFSPGTQIVAYFRQGVDASQLTPTDASPIDDRIAFMSSASSPIALVDVAARQRVPIFAELDANANPAAGERQALLIHPAVRLKFGARYAVAITTALNDGSGHALEPEGQFASWLHGGLSQSDALWQLADRLDDDASAFAAVGIQKQDLALAWDFDTASAASTTGELQTMVAQALKNTSQLGYSIGVITNNTPSQDPNIARQLDGTFQAPSFESGPDPSVLQLDSNGVPIMGAPADWSFSALISQCAAASSSVAPIVVVGHGVFSDAHDALSAAAPALNSLCAVGIGADWLGLSSTDLGILTQVLSNANNFRLITQRLEQAHVNFQVLTALAQGLLSTDAALYVNGHAAIGPSSTVFYWGESLGGIEGGTFLGLTSQAQRAELIVPGADWSLLMWRSGDFALMLQALQAVIPDWLDLQLVLAMTQSQWDKSDPIEFTALLAGTTKQALFQESEGDPIVTNVCTRTEMRSIGAQALGPLVEPVFDLSPQPGPLTGLVYTQWSIDPMPMPTFTDVPGPSDNGAHQAIDGIPEAMEQAVEFLQTGRVVNTCDDAPCVYPQGS
jgi:hypothetical protein